MKNISTLYEQDFYAWTQEQTELIQKKLFSSIDYVHLQEALQIMGASEKRELNNQLAVLLMHLLKWKYQPSRQCKSWIRTIKEQRLEVKDVLSDNPSLKYNLAGHLDNAYQKSVLRAAEETNLDEELFPMMCEWSVEQILDAGFSQTKNLLTIKYYNVIVNTRRICA